MSSQRSGNKHFMMWGPSPDPRPLKIKTPQTKTRNTSLKLSQRTQETLFWWQSYFSFFGNQWHLLFGKPCVLASVSGRRLLNLYDIFPKQRGQSFQIGSQGVRTGPDTKINDLHLSSGKKTPHLVESFYCQVVPVPITNVCKCQRIWVGHPWICDCSMLGTSSKKYSPKWW